MVKVCKCHGASGSCGVRTCWRKIVPFRNISSDIRELFNKAVLVNISSKGRKKSLVSAQTEKTKTPYDLVYLQPSPDVCATNKDSVRGRVCSKEDCSSICCGGPVTRRIVTVDHKCRCNFKWCCEVICDTCQKKVVEYRCK